MDDTRKVHIGSDHRGYELKKWLTDNKQINWVDHGPPDTERVNYPDYAKAVAEKVNQDTACLGILICGSGQGMAMTANKYPNVRAALCWDEASCRLSREHNNANILCIGADLLERSLALRLIDIFLTTDFEGGRHAARVEMISQGIC